MRQRDIGAQCWPLEVGTRDVRGDACSHNVCAEYEDGSSEQESLTDSKT